MYLRSHYHHLQNFIKSAGTMMELRSNALQSSNILLMMFTANSPRTFRISPSSTLSWCIHFALKVFCHQKRRSVYAERKRYNVYHFEKHLTTSHARTKNCLNLVLSLIQPPKCLKRASSCRMIFRALRLWFILEWQCQRTECKKHWKSSFFSLDT